MTLGQIVSEQVIDKGQKVLLIFEITSKPSEERTIKNPWPFWPFKLKTSSSHEEGSHREWSIMTKEFIGDGMGNLSGLKTVEIKWNHKNEIEEIKGTEKNLALSDGTFSSRVSRS